jgi:hypothetical protein
MLTIIPARRSLGRKASWFRHGGGRRLRQRRAESNVLPPIVGLLAAGALVGAGCGLLFFPRLVTERMGDHERAAA